MAHDQKLPSDRARSIQKRSSLRRLPSTTLEVLDTIGVSDALEARGPPIERFSIRNRDRLLMPQSITETVLRERLEQLGGRVSRPFRLMSLTQSPEVVTVTWTTEPS